MPSRILRESGFLAPLETIPLESLRASFGVDFFGQIAPTQPLIPLLRKSAGRIVFIGSSRGSHDPAVLRCTGRIKSAIASASSTFRQELAPWGITVVLVEPGFISTGADKATKARIDKLIADFTPAQAELYGEIFKTTTDAGFKTQTSGSSRKASRR